MKLAKLGSGPEIFHTIQGEGPSVGLPAVFVRASLCNLHCHWCDTDHTWNFEGTPWPHEKDGRTPGSAKHAKSEVIIEIDPTEAARRVLAYECGRTVLTGGEPLLQERAFLEMIRAIRVEKPGHVFEVETNGTRVPLPEFAAEITQFNVSPKLANSRVAEPLRLHPEAIAHFANSEKAWFKFVVAGPPDLNEIRSLCRDFAIPKDRVLLMPEGRTAADLDRSAPWLAGICRDFGFRFCDRLHIRLWGDERGV